VQDRTEASWLPLQDHMMKPPTSESMKKYIVTALIIFALLGAAALVLRISLGTVTPAGRVSGQDSTPAPDYSHTNPGTMIPLPPPDTQGGMSLNRALTLRRSVRQYGPGPLSLAHVSQLLWSAQGITNERGFRTAPSAGATLPLEMFLMANRVEGIREGIYHYDPVEHALEFIREGAPAAELARACLSQSMVTEGGAVLIFAADFDRTTARYGERGIRYVYNEIGHASQNVHLQAAALDLGTVVIGAYRDEEVEEVLQLDEPLRVLYLMPVGLLP